MALGFALMFAWTLLPIQSFDIWFFLNTGKIVLSEFRVPFSDHFLGSTAVHAFGRHANQSWLSAVIFYLFYALAGLPGLVFLRSLVLTGIAGVTYWSCRRVGLGAYWALLWTAVGLWTVRGRFLLRTVLFTDLCLALLVALLVTHDRERRFPFLKLGLLMALWVNLHQGVMAGCALVFLWVFTRSLSWDTRFKALGVAGLATLVQPYGWWFPWFYLEHFGNSTAIADVLEWSPLGLHGIVTQLGPLLLVALLAVVPDFKERRGRWGDLVIVAFFVLVACRSLRGVGEVFPVAFPLVAGFLARRQLPDRLRPVALLCVIALFYQGWLGQGPSRLGGLHPKYPEGLVRRLPPDHQQILNSYEFGNYLIFRGERPFLHGITSLYREQLLKDYLDILNPSSRREELLREYQIDTVMVHHPTAVDATELLVEYLYSSPDWRLLWWDDSGLLFVKGPGRDLTAVRPWKTKVWDDPQVAAEQLDAMIAEEPSALSLSLRAKAALEMGEFEKGLGLADRALKIQRDHFPTLLTRGSLLFKLGRLQQAEEVLRRAVRLQPESAVARFNLSLALVRRAAETGDRDLLIEARDQLRKAQELDPDFEPLGPLLQQVESAL